MTKKYLKLIIDIQDYFDEHGINYKETSTDELIVESCPSCNRQFKLYVDPETGVADCKYAGCDFSGGISPLDLIQNVMGLSRRDAFITCFGEQEKKKVNIWDEDISFGDESKGYNKKQKNKPQEISLPEIAEDLIDHRDSQAWSYLLGRGYSDKIIEKLGAKIIPETDYQKVWSLSMKKGMKKEDIGKVMSLVNRIIFPLYIDGKIMGYIARDYTDGAMLEKSKKENREYNKVLNSTGSFRSHFFWNYDNAKESSELIICEGITDAMKCGVDKSVALLGTVATSDQVELITTTKANKIIFCLDVGTDKSQESLYNQLYFHYPGKIFTVKLPELLTQKKSLLNDNIKSALEESKNCPELSYFKDNEMMIPYGSYEDMKKKYKARWYLLSDDDYNLLGEFIDTAEYKDAGDYSVSEMKDFIDNAKEYTPKEDMSLFDVGFGDD